jgi:hypothetical protein
MVEEVEVVKYIGKEAANLRRFDIFTKCGSELQNQAENGNLKTKNSIIPRGMVRSYQQYIFLR